MSNLVVQTNVLALNSHRNLKVIGNKQFQASSRLASGFKINSAADDASGLAISEKMRAQIRGLDMAGKNTQDGISLVQTAEGGLQEINNMVQRIRELSVQASNDTNDYVTNDRKKLQDEIDQLTQGIDAMSAQVEFNAKKLLDGSLLDVGMRAQLLGDIDVRLTGLIGDDQGSVSNGTAGNYLKNAAAQIEKNYTDAVSAGNDPSSKMGQLFSAAESLTADYTAAKNAAAAAGYSFVITSGKFSAAAFNSLDNLKTFISNANTDIAELMKARASAVAVGNSTIVYDKGINALKGQVDAARKLYAGAVLAESQANSWAAMSAVKGDGLWFQTGANSMQGIAVGIGGVKSDILGIGYGNGVSSVNVNVDSAIQISAFIDVVDDALLYVTSQRAMLGAVQNRMEYTKSSLEISSENLSASESRIRDADMAKEMMRLTAANILQQAGVSMMAQANQNPQSVLQLLR